MPIHDKVKIPLRVHILDNPPLFAWTEYEYYLFTNDSEHLNKLIEKDKYLQKHFQWFKNPPEHVLKDHSEPNTVYLKKLMADSCGKAADSWHYITKHYWLIFHSGNIFL